MIQSSRKSRRGEVDRHLGVGIQENDLRFQLVYCVLFWNSSLPLKLIIARIHEALEIRIGVKYSDENFERNVSSTKTADAAGKLKIWDEPRGMNRANHFG